MALKPYVCSERALALYDEYLSEISNAMAILDCEIVMNVFTSISGKSFVLCVESDYEIDFCIRYSFFGKPVKPKYLEPSDKLKRHQIVNKTNVIKHKKVEMSYTLIGELDRGLLFLREDDVLFTGTFADGIKAGFLEKIF